MGEIVKVVAIEIIYQEGKTLMQIDLWYENIDKGGRLFIDTNDFFKMLSCNRVEPNVNYKNQIGGNSIEFAEWIFKNGFEKYEDNGRYWWGKFNDDKDYSIEQLFNMWVNEKHKN